MQIYSITIQIQYMYCTFICTDVWGQPALQPQTGCRLAFHRLDHRHDLWILLTVWVIQAEQLHVERVEALEESEAESARLEQKHQNVLQKQEARHMMELQRQQQVTYSTSQLYVLTHIALLSNVGQI
jgi:hypothetical protein